MILFAVYAVGIWTIAWRYRRRWQGFAALVAGVPPVLLSARLDVWLVRVLFDEDASFLLVLGGASAGLIALIGLALFAQPRAHPAHACGACGYDLRGLNGRFCPECGADDAPDGPSRTPHPAGDQPTGVLAAALTESRRDRASNRFSAVTAPAPTSPAASTSVTARGGSEDAASAR